MISMRVVLVIPRFHPFWGGTEIRMKKIAEALSGRGFSFTVLTRRLSRRLPAEETVDGIAVVRLPAWRPLFALCVGRWLDRHRDNIDLIHSFRIDKCALPAANVARARGIPHIAEVITNEAAKMIETRAGRCALDRIAAGSDRIHCLSDDTADALVGAGVPEEKLWRRANAVDTDCFHPAPSEGDATTVLCCGRLERQKGTDVLVAAWRRLPADVACSAKLILAGGGRWLGRLRTQTDDLANVAFLGPVPRADMPALYRRADIYVQPSRFEGMSNALLEALASGLPIVTTDIAANKALVADGVNGVTVPCDDAAALTAAMVRLLNDADLRRRMGRAGRDLAVAKFAFFALIDDVETAYRRTVAAKAAP
jgi:glycosyltransferase involved in cell wall biosynthesis